MEMPYYLHVRSGANNTSVSSALRAYRGLENPGGWPQPSQPKVAIGNAGICEEKGSSSRIAVDTGI